MRIVTDVHPIRGSHRSTRKLQQFEDLLECGIGFCVKIVPETITSTMKFSSPTETSIRLQGRILKVQQNITSSPLHATTCPRSGFQ